MVAVHGRRSEAADAPVPQAGDRESPRATPAQEVKEVLGPPPVVSLEEVEPSSPRRSAIYLAVGLATPIGFFGLEGVHRFGEFFEVSAGIGIGESAVESKTNSFGGTLQWSLMPRLRLGNDHSAFTVGAGLSGGEYGGFDFADTGPGCYNDSSPCDRPFPTRYSLWANFELGGEHWTSSGFAVRYFMGVARATTLRPLGFSEGGQTALPYFGLGLGYAF
jgi:hypothetical protein